MATEEAEVAQATQAPKAGSGLVRTIGLAVGLFFLVVAAQFVTGIVGCLVLPGMMPGCTAHTEEAAGSEDGKPGKGKDAKKKEEPKAPPIYHAFDPPLVVSFQEGGTMRFLQVTVEVMGRDEHSIKGVQTHMPVIRNNLLNIFSGKGFADLTTRDGKEALRKECLTEVQSILKANSTAEEKLSVEDLYFTSFVVQ
ncbi:MAG: flagellar basal body-associated FliL family protein [Gammaproteobacteria bacterium]|nr:flagellar basal body-associated FliL family protein [Gammaproteobacteria bacterium]